MKKILLLVPFSREGNRGTGSYVQSCQPLRGKGRRYTNSSNEEIYLKTATFFMCLLPSFCQTLYLQDLKSPRQWSENL